MYFITTNQDDTILVQRTQESDDENNVNGNTIQLPNETSNLDGTLRASTQTINSQSSCDEESRISDIFKVVQSFKYFQSSVENKLM